MSKIAILGGGPGGYVAAIRAAQLGAKVTLIEKDSLGGTCLNRGCIPTKALVAAAENLQRLKKMGDFGINVSSPIVDFAKMMERKNQVVKRLVNGINFLMKKNEIELIQGTGKLISTNTILVTKEDGSHVEVETENIIIATGSEPAFIQSLGYDGDKVITSNEALELDSIPKSLLIIGGGVIGSEFACIFAELGTAVTVVDVMPSILGNVDVEVSKLMQSYFKRKKVAIKTGVKIQNVRHDSNGVVATMENGEEICAEKVLVAIGRSLNTANIGLEGVGVELGTKHEVIVDSKMRTNIPNIYAIGDVTNKIQLAHVASAQGIVAVENIMGLDKEMDYTVIPNCIYTLPEIGAVGLTTQELEAKGIPYKSGKFPFTALGKAQAMGETEGFVKLFADPETDHILGAHIIGPHATDLIAEVALAMQAGVTVEQLTSTIHAHPTLSEAVMESAEALHEKCIHL